MNRSKTKRLAIGICGAVAAAFCFALACPPFGYAAFAWLVPGVLLVSSRRLSGGAALLAGLTFGVLSAALVAPWLPSAVSGGLDMSLPLVFASVGVPYALMAAAYAFATRRIAPVDRPIVGTFLWLGADWMRAQMLGWELLGHTQFREIWLIQVADLGGVHAVSFVVAFASIAAAEVAVALLGGSIRPRAALRRMALPVAAALVAVAYGSVARSAFESTSLPASAGSAAAAQPARHAAPPAWSLRPASHGVEAMPRSRMRQVSTVDAAGMRVSPLSCEDVLDTDLVHRVVRSGADVLINNCRVPWIGGAESAAAEQHLAAAVLRSVESRRFIVRATNDGRGELITALGQTYSEAPRGEAMVIAHRDTRYMRWGDRWILIGLALSVVVVGCGRRDVPAS